MYEKLLYIIILILGFPVGIYLTWLCKDEIKAWKKRMISMSIVFLVLAVLLSFISNSIFEYKIPVIISLFFMIITNLTIVWKAG